jgi:hypothetical protein
VTRPKQTKPKPSKARPAPAPEPTEAPAPKARRGGRPRKDTRSLVVTSSETIDRACDTMVALGLSKTRETAATRLLTAAARNFLKNSARRLERFSLSDLTQDEVPAVPETPAPRRGRAKTQE